jgi:hypothetical protein
MPNRYVFSQKLNGTTSRTCLLASPEIEAVQPQITALPQRLFVDVLRSVVVAHA